MECPYCFALDWVRDYSLESISNCIRESLRLFVVETPQSIWLCAMGRGPDSYRDGM